MASGVYKRTAKHYALIKKNLHRKGPRHPHWRGNEAKYSSFHMWLRSNYGKASKCENAWCVYPRKNASGYWMSAPKLYEWALRIGHKHAHKRENYIQLCPSCHRKYDQGDPIKIY